MMLEKLQDIYNTLEEFANYDETYGLAKRYGFPTVEEAWENNPIIYLSTNPANCRKAKKKDIKNAIKDELEHYEYDDEFLYSVYKKIYTY